MGAGVWAPSRQPAARTREAACTAQPALRRRLCQPAAAAITAHMHDAVGAAFTILLTLSRKHTGKLAWHSSVNTCTRRLAERQGLVQVRHALVLLDGLPAAAHQEASGEQALHPHGAPRVDARRADAHLRAHAGRVAAARAVLVKGRRWRICYRALLRWSNVAALPAAAHPTGSKTAPTHLCTQAKAVTVAEARACIVEHARAVYPPQEVICRRLILCSWATQRQVQAGC